MCCMGEVEAVAVSDTADEVGGAVVAAVALLQSTQQSLGEWGEEEEREKAFGWNWGFDIFRDLRWVDEGKETNK